MTNFNAQCSIFREHLCLRKIDVQIGLINLRLNMFSTALPYVREMNETIQRLLKELDIKVSLKPYNTLANYFPSPKDLVEKDKLFGFICQVPCGDCNFICIAKTK